MLCQHADKWRACVQAGMGTGHPGSASGPAVPGTAGAAAAGSARAAGAASAATAGAITDINNDHLSLWGHSALSGVPDALAVFGILWIARVPKFGPSPLLLLKPSECCVKVRTQC